MGIAAYIREIGRGREGARALSRAQAADLLGQVLDGQVTDLEVGAFCLAMRIKGETPEEMAGFLDAACSRIKPVPTGGASAVVLPSYNGARRLPVLTPLLALLLARRGCAVLVHGTVTETTRVDAGRVFDALGIAPSLPGTALAPGCVTWLPTAALSPALKRLLDVRRTVGLRNPAHSLVKLLNPCEGAAVVVGSYTHPEYAQSMAATFALTGQTALLLRGTEGEPVADPRRSPRMQGFVRGQCVFSEDAQPGPLTSPPEWPADISAEATASYTRAVLGGSLPVPPPIARQMEHILRLAHQTEETP